MGALKNENQVLVNSITVLLPVYNSKQLVAKCLSSILLGLRSTDEILLINDGSEDSTPEEFLKFEALDSRIKVLNLPHQGLVSTLNTGLAHARNELVARADVDDSYNPNRFRVQAQFLDNNPQVSAVFSDYKILGNGDVDLGTIESPATPFLTWLSLINSQRTAHPSVMYRKHQVQEAGGYREEDFPVEDLALWMRLARATQLSSVPQTLLNYSIQPGGISANNQNVMMLKRRILQFDFVKNSDGSIAKNFKTDFTELKKYPGFSRRRLLSIWDYFKFLYVRDGKKFVITKDFWVVLPHLMVHFPVLQTIKVMAEIRRRKKFRSSLK